MNLDAPHPFVPPGGYLPEITLVEWLRTREERRGELPRVAPQATPASPAAR